MNSRSWWWLPWLVLLGLMLWQVFGRTTVTADLSAFLPAADKAENRSERLLLEELREGAAARLWLVVLEGGSPEELAVVARGLAKRLRESGRFSQVLDGSTLLDEATRRQLLRYRYLLDPGADAGAFATERLHEQLQNRLEELGSPLAPFEKALLPRDPTAAFRRVLEGLATAGPRPVRYQGVWMSPDHRQAFLLLESTAPGMALDAQQRNLELIRSAFDRAAAGTDVRLRLSGAPWFALQSRARIRGESQWLSLLASLFLVAFMYRVWRDPRRVVLAGIPLLMGGLGGVATTSLLFGSVHGITLAFGITLLGVALDYPVHLFAHQRRGESADAALARIWPTLRLGVLTTVIGYAAMAVTGFSGLAQLGVFSIAGLLLAAASVRYLLPHLLPPPRYEPRLLGLAGWLVRQHLPARVALPVLGVLLLLGPAMLLVRGDPWSHDIRDLSPVPAELRQADGSLRRSMGVAEPGYLIIVDGSDTEQVLQREERLQPLLQQAKKNGWLAGHEMAADILPSAKRQRLRQSRLPDAETLRTRFTRALRELPFRADAFEAFHHDVAQSRELPPLRPQDLQGSALGLRLSGLLRSTGSGARGIVRLHGLNQPQRLAAALQGAQMPGVQLLDLTAETSRLMDDFRREALERVLIGALLIVLVLLLALRDPQRVLRVVGGVLTAVSAALGLLILAGVSLSLFHLVALLLVAGLGIDYGLFFTRQEQGSDARRTALAILVCGVSTIGVFAILALSEIPVLRALGSTVALGATLAFVAAWLLAAGRSDTGSMRP